MEISALLKRLSYAANVIAAEPCRTGRRISGITEDSPPLMIRSNYF